jgi:hypothetical protein
MRSSRLFYEIHMLQQAKDQHTRHTASKKNSTAGGLRLARGDVQSHPGAPGTFINHFKTSNFN